MRRQVRPWLLQRVGAEMLRRNQSRNHSRNQSRNQRPVDVKKRWLLVGAEMLRRNSQR